MMRTTDRFRRRGVAYVFFLTTAMLVTVIGLSALIVVRIELRTSEGVSDAAEASLCARSAIDLAVLNITNDTNWTKTVTHDTWEPKQAIGAGVLTWKVVDERDGTFTVDPGATVRVYGQAVVGDAVRVYSALVQPPLVGPPPNTLINGDFESGLSPWWNAGSCDLEIHTDQPHGGAAYLWIKNRESEDAVARQTVAEALQNGATYRSELWVRLKEKPEDVRFGVWVHSDNGWEYSEFPETAAGTSWTQLSGTIAPTWSGSFIEAIFEVGTTQSNQEFMIDDVSLSKVPTMIGLLPGTWRREGQ